MTTESENDLPESDWNESDALGDAQLQFEANAEDSMSDVNLPSMSQLQAQVADAEKRVLLAQADLENFRRRTRRDLQDQLRYASLGLIAELLDAVDNLNRAIEAHEKDPAAGGLVEGVKLVAQQISNLLQNHGCEKIDAVGKPFDPTRHQAVQMQPSDDVPPNTVLMDLRPGFQLHDRVVRPSQVFVSTDPASS